MSKFFKNLLMDDPNTDISLLSIGAGTGYFDKNVIDKSIQYTGIEPNLDCFTRLKENMTTFECELLNIYFTTETILKSKYDYILMSHCLYYSPNYEELIKHALKYLNENGKLVVFHITDKGIYEFVKFAYNYIIVGDGTLPLHSFNTSDIVKKLVKFEEIKLYSYIDMRNVFDDEDILNDMLSFFIQTNFKMLDDDIKVVLIEKLKSMTDNLKFEHHVGIIVISN